MMKNVARTVRSVIAALALLAPVVLGATDASAAPRQSIVYDALGDSYASGFGVPPYEACGRSQSAYAVQLDGRMRINLDDFVACAGATTATLVTGGQLKALDRHTDLVTISIGGNDIGWSSAVGACLAGTDKQCADNLALMRSKTRTVLPRLLDSVYSKVSAKAPNAHVIITGYPRLFSPGYGPIFAASVNEQKALNDGADLLNGVIAKAAAKHCFQFVDVTKRFLGHGVNAPHAWISGPLDPVAPFHPNAHGYRAYTAAVKKAIRHSW